MLFLNKKDRDIDEIFSQFKIVRNCCGKKKTIETSERYFKSEKRQSGFYETSIIFKDYF